MADARNAAEGDAAPAAATPTTAPEWVVSVVGAAMVLVVIGLLAHEALAGPGGPPDVTVTADSVTRGRGGWVVHFTARNAGGATAAALAVRATLAAGADTVERDAEIDYLPARSERRGGFAFPRDPRRGTLRLEAGGYEEP